MSSIKQVQRSIAKYAKGYAELERLQHEEHALIPKCDQKTGAIGEFYAMLYAKNIFANSGRSFEFGQPSQHGWDIRISDDEKEVCKIQVKTVSGFSKTSTISPIHTGWDELWLLRLNKSFYPVALWVVNDSGLVGEGEVLSGCKMPQVGKLNTGSLIFEKKDNRTEKFLAVLADL